jgi:hypothetical protein
MDNSEMYYPGRIISPSFSYGLRMKSRYLRKTIDGNVTAVAVLNRTRFRCSPILFHRDAHSVPWLGSATVRLTRVAVNLDPTFIFR